MENIEQRIEQVRNDREHGSRWLVREAMLILRDLAAASFPSQEEQMQRLQQAGRTLAQARPAMAALAAAVGYILNVQGGPAAVAQAAEAHLQAYDKATELITTHASPLLQGRLMTCSISGTVLDVLIACRQQIEEVVVLEGRPRYEGRVMAQSLSAQGIAVTLITDAQADIFLPSCTAVVVGADSVLANGDVLNKAGTALLAWAARGHHLPFYVLCETLKISAHRWSADLSMLEEKEPEEVLEQPPTGVSVRNFYFDRTPYKLITGLLTERGPLRKQEISALAETVRKNARSVGL
jgi:ribose 1,5-bisphosphate isomerase